MRAVIALAMLSLVPLMADAVLAPENRVPVQRPRPNARSARTRDRFVGTWRLVSVEQRTPAGEVSNPMGPHPTGLIMYDSTGHMAVQIMREGRAQYAAAEPSPEEAKAALTSYTAYFGTFSVNEADRTVTHHRDGNLNPGAARDATRSFEFSSDRLILTPVETRDRHLTWERVR